MVSHLSNFGPAQLKGTQEEEEEEGERKGFMFAELAIDLRKGFMSLLFFLSDSWMKQQLVRMAVRRRQRAIEWTTNGHLSHAPTRLHHTTRSRSALL